ncbi:Dabb family protein [Rhizobium sp. L1K21]|uniref:Dabb family protein n=1 Tax=Rhizobium sp. L1K21 TaxID=2954933 RepID=UPI002093B4BC|nr:Dabb family protein [Rhizobium sp. L1K21]MCO6188121.1 Dabb family protein [Rhizobium sp. L1K21]
MMIDIPDGAVIHTVLFSFYDDVDECARQSAVEMLRSAGHTYAAGDDGLLYWRVNENLDLRKNWHLVEIGIFADHESLRRFVKSEIHQAVAERFRTISNWAVGDLMS